MTTTIKTNGHARELWPYFDLPAEVDGQFDYVPDGERYDNRFFRYRGSWYDVNDGFERIVRESAKLRDPLAYDPFGIRVSDDSPLLGWDGAQAESAFSAVLIRWAKEWDGTTDYDAVVVGYAHW